MGSLVYTLVSMVQVASLHCSMRPEISPCSCAPHEAYNNTIHVNCEGLASFNQVFDSLQNKFSTKDAIWLKITRSQLDDLETRNFKDMNMNITKLFLNNDDLRNLPESSFRNFTNLGFLSLADNNLEEIPRHIFAHMPKIVTIDLGNGRIKSVLTDDFRHLNDIRHLVLVNNNIRYVEKDSIPKTVRFLHLGRNNLTSLNGTLRGMEYVNALFLNENNLTTLDDELPIKSTGFRTLIAHHNKLQRLTQDLTKFMKLDAMYLSDNELISLDRVFQNASFIQTLSAHNNKIQYLAEDEFLNSVELTELDLANNYIRALNNSLLPLKRVRICNFSRNRLDEISLNDLRGLTELQVVDLSFNLIEKISGRLENVVEQDLHFIELRLDHNLLKSLDGGLMNLNQLRTLDISFNKLKWISSNDLIGLENLETLDISHNYLQTLQEMSMTFLPNLEKLYSSFNNLSKLERDFHGLPVLCFADLSNNHITYISPELVAKTRCNSHGVINKLEILLQENPILCMDELSKLFALMEVQETRLLGIAHCIVTKDIVPKEEEIPVIEPVFVPPSMLSAQEELEKSTPLPSNSDLIPAHATNQTENSEIDQIIEPEKRILETPSDVPSIILSSLSKSIATEEPIREIIPTTTDVQIPNPNENDVDIVTYTEKSNVLTAAPDAENDTVLNTLNYINQLESVTISTNYKSTTHLPTENIETTTASTSSLPPPLTTSSTTSLPIKAISTTSSSSILLTTPPPPTSPPIAEIVLGEMDSVSKSPPNKHSESDNYIYETFSPISPVNISAISSFHQSDHLVLAEEPPEIPNDAVSAA